MSHSRIRFMRVIVFFDLPVMTPDEQKTATKFRNELLKIGYIMLQESVYCKLALTLDDAKREIEKLRIITPMNGTVSILTVTERQYSSMLTISNGKFNNDTVISSTDELIVL